MVVGSKRSPAIDTKRTPFDEGFSFSLRLRSPTLRLRILLAVTTGPRRGDIEAIRIGDIHFDRNTITTRNRKAKKAMADRPIPEQIMTELSNYIARLPDGQEPLFADRFSPKKWE